MSSQAGAAKAQAAQPALWQQLVALLPVLAGMAAGRSFTDTLAQVTPALRPGVQAFSFHAARHWGQAQILQTQLVRGKMQAEVQALLGVALVLLATEPLWYPSFTVVDQAVQAAKHQRSTRAAAGLINACLRRYLRERASLDAACAQHTVARWNYPAWWVQRCQQDHAEQWEPILAGAQQAPPMVLRVNRQRASVDEVLQNLAQAGLAARSLGEQALLLEQAMPVEAIPGFAAGQLSVQGASAQRAAGLLLHGLQQAAPRILDACAAPGGKTAHLLELQPRAQVTALDIDATRLQRVQHNLQRLGLQAQCRAADAADPPSWWDGQAFDAILLDAPCSGSGVVRRHPDIRWLRRPSDIQALAARQDALLNALWPLLRVGGRLLFCTCSVFRAEGSERAEGFVSRHADARELPAPGHLLPVWDNSGRDDDGFFYALFEKQPV